MRRPPDARPLASTYDDLATSCRDLTTHDKAEPHGEKGNTMNAFIVDLADQPGEMARVTGLLAQHDINVLVHGLAGSQGGAIGFIAGDEAAARTVLETADIAVTQTPVVTVRMHDQPGQAAQVSEQLANAGINVRFWLPVDTTSDAFTVAIGVSDVEEATRVLGGRLVEWNYA